MARNEDVAKLLKAGHSPTEIANDLGISLSSVAQYLYTAVGRGLICRSDIIFKIDEEIAFAVESAIEHYNIRTRWDLQTTLKANPAARLTRDDLEEALLYFDLRSAPLADMYELLCMSERFLHNYIRLTLTEEAGSSDGFWRKLPLAVRQDCVCMKEEDEEPEDDPYAYSTFIHLKVIFEKKWHVLSKKLPQSVRSDKKMFLDNIQNLNRIRNRVMHPVRGYRPTSADFEYVREFTIALFGASELDENGR